MKKNILQLIQNYSEGKLNLSEQIELSEQLSDEQNENAEQILLDDFQYHLESESGNNQNLQPLLDRIHHQIHRSESQTVIRPNFWQRFQRIAAILIMPLILSFAAYLYFKPESKTQSTYAEIQCPMGARIKFQLPDGSIGFLNSGASLRYPVQFAAERSVDLIGEAYFDVVHNEKQPFHVNTKNLDIRVLGTKFNVIANDDESTEEVILQSGKVDVSSQAGKQLAILKPNEELSLDTKQRTFVKRQVEASQYTSWKDGKLVFRNENMQQVARRLSRWYNAQVVVDDHQLDDYTFHATFIDEPLDEVLKLLSLTTPLSFSEDQRSGDIDGVYEKRKIILKLNRSKISHF